jgi:hypothetical protein
MCMGGKEVPLPLACQAQLVNPSQGDQDCEASAADARDRRRFNEKVLTVATSFAGSTGLSFRKVAGDAIFKLVSDLTSGYQFLGRRPETIG